MRLFRKDDAGGVGAHMAGNAGQHVDPRVRGELEVELLRPEGDAGVEGQGKGGTAQLRRIDAEQKVVHDRVGDEGGIEEIAGLEARFGTDLPQQAVDALAHGLGHFPVTARVHHDVGHPAHQVFAEADLRVHDAAGGQYFTGGKIAEVRGNGGGADVDRDPIGLVVKTRPNRRQDLSAVDRDRDLPVALAQRLLQPLQDAQVHAQVPDVEVLYTPLLLQRQQQPLQVARGVVHVGLLDLDVVQPHRGIELDVADLGALADNLLVDLAVGGHIDDQIVEQQCLAREAPSRLLALARMKTFLDGVPLAGVVELAADAVLGEVAGAELDLAAPTEAAPAADGIDVHAELPCALQQGSTDREVPPSAGWREDDQGVLGRLAHRHFTPGQTATRRRRLSPRPSRPPAASSAAAGSRNFRIQRPQPGSTPFMTLAAMIPTISSWRRGFMIADVMPAPAAMARKAALRPWRWGRPKEMLEAPQVVLTPSSSRRRRSRAKTC